MGFKCETTNQGAKDAKGGDWTDCSPSLVIEIDCNGIMSFFNELYSVQSSRQKNETQAWLCLTNRLAFIFTFGGGSGSGPFPDRQQTHLFILKKTHRLQRRRRQQLRVVRDRVRVKFRKAKQNKTLKAFAVAPWLLISVTEIVFIIISDLSQQVNSFSQLLYALMNLQVWECACACMHLQVREKER